MLSKEIRTVRVANIDPSVKKAELYEFFRSRNFRPAQGISLCTNSHSVDDTQVATVTFTSSSEAHRALSLKNEYLMSRQIEIDNDFMGLTVLAGPEKPEIDIIAIHGLNGHAFATWVYQEENLSTEVMWLRDFLPAKVKTAQIMVYGYNSVLMGSKTSVSEVEDFATDLLQRITLQRTNTQNRPLIFICHSLGGIVTKQALVLAHADTYRYSSVWNCSHSVLFLATPHHGSKSADIGKLASKVAKLAFQNMPQHLLNTLKPNSAMLQKITTDFSSIRSKLNITSFYERRKTPILNSLVVDEHSARVGFENETSIPIDATHSDICKFSGPSHAIFIPILAHIQRSCKLALEDDNQKTKRNPQPEGSDTHRPKSVQEGYFLVPLSRNLQFLGRDDELSMLDSQLTEPECFSCSTYPSVAIYGLGGVGKTQLVAEFIFRRKRTKPNASIFWVTAANQADVDSQFQDIATQISQTRSRKSRFTEFPRSKLNKEVVPENERPDVRGFQFMKDWMIEPGNEDWVLVLDNLDNLEVKVSDYIPVGATGSVIITSRNSRIVGTVANSGFKLASMNTLSSERLLVRLQSSSSDRQWNDVSSHPEYSVIKQIVYELDSFPLAIDQAAAFIRENSPMTFQEYLNFLKPRSEDRELLMRFKEINPRYPESVMTTWEVSLRHVETTQKRAYWILQLLGFLDHSQVSESILTGATKVAIWKFGSRSKQRKLPSEWEVNLAYLKDDAGFRLAIGALTALSLVTRNFHSPQGPTLSVHPLVHEWIRVRLKHNPLLQAKLTVAATLVMFQSFPLEEIVRVHDEPVNESKETPSQVSRHLTSVLLNFRDYHEAMTEVPLECFLLFEVIYLGVTFEYPSTHRLPKDLVRKLDLILRKVSSKTSLGLGPLASFIHKAIVSIRSKRFSNADTGCQQKSRFIDSLSKLSLDIALEDSHAILLMLIIVTLTRISDDTLSSSESFLATDLAGRKTLRSGIAVLSQQPTSNSASAQVPQRELNLRILRELCRLLRSAPHSSSLSQQITGCAEFRLTSILTESEYNTRTEFSLEENLAEHMYCLYFVERGARLSLCARLLWECQGYKDLDRLKKVLWCTLKEVQIALDERKVDQDLERWSHSSYISSAAGRTAQANRNKGTAGENLVTPLDYIWSMMLPLAEAISDPSTAWRAHKGAPNDKILLTDSEREYAPVILHKMKDAYDKAFQALNGLSAKLEVEKSHHFDQMEMSLAIIYMNLKNWLMFQDVTHDALKLDEVMTFCRSEPRLLREIERVAWHDNVPLSSSSHIESERTSSPREQTQASAQRISTPTNPPGNMYNFTASRLRKAAEQRKAIQKPRVLNGLTVNQEDVSGPAKILLALELPLSFGFLTNRHVDTVLAAFVKMVQQDCAPPDDRNEAFRDELYEPQEILEVIKGMGKEDAYAKCIGRLELAYRLYELQMRFQPRMTTTSNSRDIPSSKTKLIFDDFDSHSIDQDEDLNQNEEVEKDDDAFFEADW